MTAQPLHDEHGPTLADSMRRLALLHDSEAQEVREASFESADDDPTLVRRKYLTTMAPTEARQERARLLRYVSRKREEARRGFAA